MILVVGYDREICNDYGSNCRDSDLSKAFHATGDALEASLTVSEVIRIDIKELDLQWLNTEKTARESRSDALLRALSDASTAIIESGGRVSALVFVGHGIGAGNVGLSFRGESVNVMVAAQKAQLAKRGAIIVLACSVAVQMDLSRIRTQEYRVFATKEFVDWLENGKVKLSSQHQSEYTLANNLSLPEQTLSPGVRDANHLQMYQTAPTIQEALLQAAMRTTSLD